MSRSLERMNVPHFRVINQHIMKPYAVTENKDAIRVTNLISVPVWRP